MCEFLTFFDMWRRMYQRKLKSIISRNIQSSRLLQWRAIFQLRYLHKIKIQELAKVACHRLSAQGVAMYSVLSPLTIQPQHVAEFIAFRCDQSPAEQQEPYHG